jgi:Serine carboxypeptidase
MPVPLPATTSGCLAYFLTSPRSLSLVHSGLHLSPTHATQLHTAGTAAAANDDGLPVVDPPERVAGYFKLNRTYDAHMFYFFYESRSKQPDDPVLLWMTGKCDERRVHMFPLQRRAR